jgi:hypothetical protein
MSSDAAQIAKTEFETAVTVARHALEQFNLAPLVESQRGAPRISSWWKVYREASEIAVKWHRELRALEPRDTRWIDSELDRLLQDGEG